MMVERDQGERQDSSSKATKLLTRTTYGCFSIQVIASKSFTCACSPLTRIEEKSRCRSSCERDKTKAAHACGVVSMRTSASGTSVGWVDHRSPSKQIVNTLVGPK